MSDHYCVKEKQWGELDATLKYIKERLTTHVVEGEKEGGWRDRLLVTEERQRKVLVEIIPDIKKEVSTIKRGYWLSGILGGIIGGLLGKITPDIINFFIKTVMAGQ